MAGLVLLSRTTRGSYVLDPTTEELSKRGVESEYPAWWLGPAPGRSRFKAAQVKEGAAEEALQTLRNHIHRHLLPAVCRQHCSWSLEIRLPTDVALQADGRSHVGGPAGCLVLLPKGQRCLETADKSGGQHQPRSESRSVCPQKGNSGAQVKEGLPDGDMTPRREAGRQTPPLWHFFPAALAFPPATHPCP